MLRTSLAIVGLSLLTWAGSTFSAAGASAPDWIDLSTLDAWKEPHAEWALADSVRVHPDNPKLLAFEPGKEILVNGPKGRTKNLLTKQDFGDVEVQLEFFIPKSSNSGIKFEGLYEIQIFDSYGVKMPTGSDCGGIYPRAELKPNYHHIDNGIAPKVNAAKPPGEWQTLEAIFLAPRFDAAGKKTANARFVKVVLNGQVIHENVDVPTPTGHAWHDPEKPTGPLLLQADHGPVAFRKIRARNVSEKGQ